MAEDDEATVRRLGAYASGLNRIGKSKWQKRNPESHVFPMGLITCSTI
jgi:hypothetical protein